LSLFVSPLLLLLLLLCAAVVSSLWMDDSIDPRQTIPLAPEDLEEKIQCRVLDCDTISQVKHKILDALYRNTPFSLRPSIHEVNLGMTTSHIHSILSSCVRPPLSQRTFLVAAANCDIVDLLAE